MGLVLDVINVIVMCSVRILFLPSLIFAQKWGRLGGLSLLSGTAPQLNDCQIIYNNEVLMLLQSPFRRNKKDHSPKYANDFEIEALGETSWARFP
jgi:hypothetical protein